MGIDYQSRVADVRLAPRGVPSEILFGTTSSAPTKLSRPIRVTWSWLKVSSSASVILNKLR